MGSLKYVRLTLWAWYQNAIRLCTWGGKEVFFEVLSGKLSIYGCAGTSTRTAVRNNAIAFARRTEVTKSAA